MAKGPTKQHYVPQCYLREWVNPNTPSGQEPYVWIFNRGEKSGKKKAPSNIFTETDLYTLHHKSGKKNYAIEETLSNLEGKYATVFREKISKHLPLTEEEHIYLCAFVAAMMQRTPRYRDNMNRFYDELASHAEAMEQAHGAPTTESTRIRAQKENNHKLTVMQLLPDITEMLLQMSVAFLCTTGRSKFVTSDDPCSLFNPDLQWQRFYGPGLEQQNVQLTLPLSPSIMLCLSWSPLRGHIRWSNSEVEEANRMTINSCYKYFVSHGPKTRRHWFRRYPLDFFFILKILRHQISMRWYQVKRWYEDRKYHHVRKR